MCLKIRSTVPCREFSSVKIMDGIFRLVASEIPANTDAVIHDFRKLHCSGTTQKIFQILQRRRRRHSANTHFKIAGVIIFKNLALQLQSYARYNLICVKIEGV